MEVKHNVQDCEALGYVLLHFGVSTGLLTTVVCEKIVCSELLNTSQ